MGGGGEAQSIFFHYFLRRQNGQWVFFSFSLVCSSSFRRKRAKPFGRVRATVALANAFRNKFPNQLLWLYPLSTSQSSCEGTKVSRAAVRKRPKGNKQTIRQTIKTNVLFKFGSLLPTHLCSLSRHYAPRRLQRLHQFQAVPIVNHFRLSSPRYCSRQPT